jgi:hypothetical protein
MLGYYETKNIGRKRERAQAFEALGDRTSETDMEFDWADETLHVECESVRAPTPSWPPPRRLSHLVPGT